MLKKHNFTNLYYSELVIFITIFVVALFPRLLLLYFSDYQNTIQSDEIRYHSFALSILNSGSFSMGGRPTSMDVPLYPLFLSLIYKFCGEKYIYAKIAQSLMGAFQCYVIFLIGKKVFGFRVAIVSGLICAFYPPFIYLNDLLASENLFSFLLSLVVLAFINTNISKAVFRYFLPGLLMGLCALTRPIALFIPFFMSIILFFYNDKKSLLKMPLISSAVIIFAMFLIISPWTIRNYFVHDEFVLLTTKGGYGLWTSNNPKEGKIFGFETTNSAYTTRLENLSEVERSKFYFNKAIEQIKEEPVKIAKLTLLKALFFWIPLDWEIIARGERTFNLMYLFISPFFIIALLAYLPNSNHQIWTLFSFIIYFFCMSLIFYGSPRFRLPVDPFIILIGCEGIKKHFHWFSKKTMPAGIIGFYIIFLFYININIAEVTSMAKSLLASAKLW